MRLISSEIEAVFYNFFAAIMFWGMGHPFDFAQGEWALGIENGKEDKEDKGRKNNDNCTDAIDRVSHKLQMTTDN
ncbi:hypothetical protein H6G33_14480 [Calothrix sp. FACHB-1219]|uniref:hypothetical protein n=1 Tax=unclassified Calothrix TaxID=2619626 RepID=UPI001681EF3F|nr:MULTISPECIES: hypothetical protein [unclassified Calothrix]MBD2203972.1 hypothetical protein [Calothrix sp. FACHB-168]MBD2218243.1 hypothetical protein [Calothrix sp. FACHB-1219]